jgi:hypothetical protein
VFYSNVTGFCRMREKAAKDITRNVTQRNWHRNAVCSWHGKFLTLTAENDFDREGRATMDEFSDEISACISGGFDGEVRIVSVTEIASGAQG